MIPVNLQLPVQEVLVRAERWLREGARYDIVHLDTIGGIHLAGPLRRLFERGSQQPVIVCSLNDSYSLLLNGPSLERTWRNAAYGRVIERYERRWLPTADLIDVVSQRDVDWLRSVSPRARTRLVPLGVDVREFDGPRLPPKWDILYLGSLAPGGTFRFVKRMFDAAIGPVASQLRHRPEELRVALAGPPPPPATAVQVRSLPATRLGFVEDLSELLRSTRMVVVPSDQQSGTPTKALQAMAAGTPVVGMRALDGIPNGADHVTFSRASGMTEFRDRILRVLGDDRYARDIGEGGRNLVRCQHDWPVVIRRYLDVAHPRPR